MASNFCRPPLILICLLIGKSNVPLGGTLQQEINGSVRLFVIAVELGNRFVVFGGSLIQLWIGRKDDMEFSQEMTPLESPPAAGCVHKKPHCGIEPQYGSLTFNLIGS